jgi:antitoxin (DNA-binding transcriptional repressor) of toxin-antitoxin stability system
MRSRAETNFTLAPALFRFKEHQSVHYSAQIKPVNAIIRQLLEVAMQLVQFTEFRNNASKYLDLVEQRGETIQILRSGKPVAQLVPSIGIKPDVAREVQSWKNPSWKPLAMLDPNGPSVSDLLREDRSKGL